MKKLKIILLNISSYIFFPITVTSAADINTDIGTIQGPVSGSIVDVISNLTSYIRPLIAVVFLFVIIYGGFTRMTAAGDAEKEKKSNAILTAGVVGFIIIVLAPVIVRLVSSLIGIRGNVL